MFKDLFKNYIYPIAVFSGGMVGVGFLSLPYIALQSGIWLMLFYFLVLTSLVVAINLIFCQISLKTPDYKRFPGFVGYYLGKWPKFYATVSMILVDLGVFLVYLLIGSQFLSLVFKPLFAGNILIYAFIYFFAVSIIIYFDIKVIARAEFWVIVLLFLFLIFIFIESFSYVKFSNVFLLSGGGMNNFFLPYGALLFSLWGIVGLTPEVEEMMRGEKKRLKTVIVISTITTSVFYALFVFLILAISGKQTDPTALQGIQSFLPRAIVSAAVLMGALATIAAFITGGIIFKKTLMFDLKIKHWQAFVMTCLPPMVLFLLGFKSFIPILSFVGGFFLGIDGILILLMYKKIGGKNIIIYPLSLVFLLGVIYEIIYFVK